MQDIVPALILIGLGLIGLFAPYRWNLLRLKGIVEPLVPASWRPRVPKILGGIFLAMGGIMLAVGLFPGAS